ncbi:MAG: energy-coupling factor ABC transporter ATP-binding protein [Bacilli bacterium]|nr:energy-coupling factor ABC transporter ATP-binding protein [Bacilli bacterium]MDD4282777.1 energy-coupling factor ABC transporter ATP-binding protein [Bacilli bacterium]MDD4718341.1 energy-coupling factor ABC transporter ATP-binding protein [Bacilli bacterium]
MDIKFNKVGYIYNEKTPLQKEILKDLNLEIKKNQINAIIGKSGSGKTTIIEMINALIIPTSGSILIDNCFIEKQSKIVNISVLRFNVGLIFEFPEEQFFNSTVEKEIEFGLKTFNYKTDEISKRVSNALKMVGLNESYLSRNPHTLSNGEKRKVAIASILVFNPKVIIFDEPTIGLDSNSKNNLMRLIKMLKNKYNKTIIIVTQDVDFLHKFTDYIFVLSDKKVILEGNKYQVFSETELLSKHGIGVPKTIEFSSKVFQIKDIKMGYRDEINDLIKDIYRYAK